MKTLDPAVVAIVWIVVAALLFSAGRALMLIPRADDELPELLRSARELTLTYALQTVVMVGALAALIWVVVGLYG